MPRFTPDFLDELKARLRPSDVIGRHVKLKKQGNEWAGLSPFTKEKSPSFFVNDQKAFYHCFSSGKHGDIIGFLMETQKMTFVEAVTRLAEEAGLPLPADDPGEARAEEARKGLIEACEAAMRFFASSLRRSTGREALDYLKRRGVSDDQIEEFGIGYAPGDRAALKDYLINKNFHEETLVEAGLLIRPEDRGDAYDRFRDRVMFPIVDARNRIVAFGGRALSKDAKAKYLNSPETPVFHKGSVLYNYPRAREAAQKDGRPLIVCEGYMDVVALWGAGFHGAVAPLGTALTENQIALLWRVSDEPVLCFDGDKAGIGASHRAIDRALPLLKPGKSLSFAFLPSGRDPDDLVREQGAAGFERILETTKSLADVVWMRETEARPLDTPERRAALKSQLRELVRTIADKDVRDAYGAFLLAKLDEGAYFRPSGKPQGHRRPGQGQRQARGGARFDAAPGAAPLRQAPSAWRREATLVLALINHPSLIEAKEAEIIDLSFEAADMRRLLDAAIDACFASPGLDREGLKAHLRQSQAAEALERILSDETLNRQSFLRPEAELDEVEWGWRDALRHHLIATDSVRELAETAAQSFSDGENVWKAAITAREELRNAGGPERQRTASEGDVSSDEFLSRLERMRETVRRKRDR